MERRLAIGVGDRDEDGSLGAEAGLREVLVPCVRAVVKERVPRGGVADVEAVRGASHQVPNRGWPSLGRELQELRVAPSVVVQRTPREVDVEFHELGPD